MLDEFIENSINKKIKYYQFYNLNIIKKFFQIKIFFSCGVEFTGRIIKYISEEISKSNDDDDLSRHLVNAFYLNYINSINNKNDTNNIITVKKISH